MHLSGFREVKHTADWEIRAWAPNLEDLFIQSARGMYTLIGIKHYEEQIEKRKFSISSIDHEGLLVGFLSELLYFLESEYLWFDKFELEISNTEMLGELSGGKVISLGKEIKAVTWNNIGIKKRKGLMWVNIVFDV